MLENFLLKNPKIIFFFILDWYTKASTFLILNSQDLMLDDLILLTYAHTAAGFTPLSNSDN